MVAQEDKESNVEKSDLEKTGDETDNSGSKPQTWKARRHWDLDEGDEYILYRQKW